MADESTVQDATDVDILQRPKRFWTSFFDYFGSPKGVVESSHK